MQLIFLASIPAALFGFFFHGIIKTNLFNPLVVVISLVLGGIIIIIVENRKLKTTFTSFENISKKKMYIYWFFSMLGAYSWYIKIWCYHHWRNVERT